MPDCSGPLTSSSSWNEADRLKAIDAYAILDTPREEDYDDIVKLAAEICDMPVSLVTIVAEGRQWFKAEVGVGLRETSLDVSICKHTIRQDGLFIVPDTTKDPLFRTNPDVIGGPRYRFYAGAVVKTPEGLPIGTVCVLDYKSRALTKRQELTLNTLARQVMIRLELRRALKLKSEGEEQLRESELRYRRLFEAAQEGLLILDFNTGCVTDANPFLVELLGLSCKEMIGKKMEEIPSFRGIFSNPAVWERLRQGEYVRFENLRLPRRDGGHVDVEFIGNIYEAGSKKLVQCSLRDFTEVRKAEARARLLVDSNVQGVFFWKKEGAITSANDAFLNLVRYTREELEAGELNWIALTPPECAHLDRQGRQSIEARGVCEPYEKQFLRKDGSRVPILLGAAVFEGNRDEGVCFVLDLTDRKRLEQQFLRSQRMESIGTLAVGIAHELNNDLAPLVMSITLLQGMTENAQARKILETIEFSARKGAEIIRQVLSFVRGVEGTRIEIQPKRLLHEIEIIVKGTFPKNIELNFSDSPDLWRISGDPTQLHQILLNLCVNARDAMPHGGCLNVEAKNCVLDELHVATLPQLKPGRYVQISVTDNGTGMPLEVLSRIFEPFFTTKDIGKGAGLGLSTVQAVAKSHDGTVNASSESGKGATFDVYLPALETPSDESRKGAHATDLPRGNGELVLVVEDETPFREIVSQTLEAFGYRVLTASDGVEGVTAYTQHRNEIAVVLTDMMMPIMDGVATIQALIQINPKVKIIAASGLGSGGAPGKLVTSSVRHFLTKPYATETLLQTLRAILKEG
jgi:PAS domain S-box-containing protein